MPHLYYYIFSDDRAEDKIRTVKVKQRIMYSMIGWVTEEFKSQINLTIISNQLINNSYTSQDIKNYVLLKK